MPAAAGCVVLDLVARDPRVTRVTLVEPDVYKPHNVHRHLFPRVGRRPAEGRAAAEWLRERRPDLDVDAVVADLTDPARQADFARVAAACDVGVCAVDNEPAKYALRRPDAAGRQAVDARRGAQRRHRRLGPPVRARRAVLRLRRQPPAAHRDRGAAGPAARLLATPAGRSPETTVPASKASIAAIASLHAVVTLDAADGGSPAGDDPEASPACCSPWQRGAGCVRRGVPAVPVPHPAAAACLICCGRPRPVPAEDLDVALDQALARLGDE